MFSENRGELAIPVVGSLLLGLATLFAAISIFDAKWDFFEIGFANSQVFLVFGILLGFISFFALSKIYMLEGILTGVFAVFFLAYSDVAFPAHNIYHLAALALVLSIAIVILAIMAYRSGDFIMLVFSIASLVAFLPILLADTADSTGFLIAGVGLAAVGVVALINAILEWIFLEDFAAELAEYMYGDDCGCEDEECDCNEA